MTVDQASVFFVGSILTVMGFVVVVGGIVIINNLLHKYWKPVQLFKWTEHPSSRFLTPEEVTGLNQTTTNSKP